MVVIARAVVIAYDEDEHRADVRPVGSLAGVLTGIPVATDIPVAAVVAGRECTLLLYTEDDPTDAVVLTIHGALPPAPPTGVETHGELTGVGAHDHHLAGRIEHPASDTRMDAVSGAIEARPAGTLRHTIKNTYPQILGVPGTARFGYGSGAAGGTQAVVADNGSETTAPGSTIIQGVAGRAFGGTNDATAAHGLDYVAGLNSGITPTMTEIDVIRGGFLSFASGASITAGHGLRLFNVGLLFGNWSAIYGVRVHNIAGSAQRRPFQEEGVANATADAHGNRFRSNTQFGSLTGSFGGGNGVIGIADAVAAPSANPTGGGILYAAAGALMWRGSAGTVTTIAPA